MIKSGSSVCISLKLFFYFIFFFLITIKELACYEREKKNFKRFDDSHLISMIAQKTTLYVSRFANFNEVLFMCVNSER
jgi:hypothetical protein